MNKYTVIYPGKWVYGDIRLFRAKLLKNETIEEAIKRAKLDINQYIVLKGWPEKLDEKNNNAEA